MKVIQFLLAVLLFATVTSFPNGAPSIACKPMVPGHLPTTTSGQNPFMLKISATSYKPGDVITGELYSANNLTFRGFLIEVGIANNVDQEEQGVGEFINLNTGIQKHVCGEAGVTHINNQDKQRVSFTWKAPDTSVGDLFVRATVVERFFPSRYWLGAFSQRITAA